MRTNKIVKSGFVFQENSLIWVLFAAKMSLKMGRGFDAQATHSTQAKFEYAPEERESALHFVLYI